jgi:hypothetical protein
MLNLFGVAYINGNGCGAAARFADFPLYGVNC